MLEEAQIHPGGVVVIEIPQGSFLKQFADLPHCPGEQKGMVDHNLEILLERKVDQFLALLRVAGERLLDEDVLAVLESSLGQLIMRPHRGDHGDHVDFSRQDDVRGVCRDQDAGISLLRALAGRRADLRDCYYLGTLQTRKISHDVWSPIAVTNYTKVHVFSPLVRTAVDAREDWMGMRGLPGAVRKGLRPGKCRVARRETQYAPLPRITARGVSRRILKSSQGVHDVA